MKAILTGHCYLDQPVASAGFPSEYPDNGSNSGMRDTFSCFSKLPTQVPVFLDLATVSELEPLTMFPPFTVVRFTVTGNQVNAAN